MLGGYWWILAKDPDTGKSFLIAGGENEQEARQKGLETLAGIDFRLKQLPTRNMARASAIIRGNKLEQTHSLRRASERIGHDRSVSRMIRDRRKFKRRLEGL